MGTTTIVEREDGLVTVTLNRPQRKNAISATMWNELDEIVSEVEVNPGDRALVLTGAEGNFSSGADLSGEESNGLTGHGPQLVLHEMRIVGRIIGRLKALPKPTIAAVDGVAVGVALGIALACDLVIATDRARFMEVFVKRGLALDGGTSWTLPHLVGPRRAKQMAFFGEHRRRRHRPRVGPDQRGRHARGPARHRGRVGEEARLRADHRDQPHEGADRRQRDRDLRGGRRG